MLRPLLLLTFLGVRRSRRRGYHLEKLDNGTMGHPTAAHLPDWHAAVGFQAPPPRKADRMAGLPEFLDTCGDRYRLASLDLSGFTVYTLLRGFENSMVDFLTEPERFAWLMDMIVDFECEMMALAARRGFHGIHFADNWGTQSGLMISPKLWRTVQAALPAAVRPGTPARPAPVVSLLRQLRRDCQRLPRAGADVLNIAQPNVMDIPPIGQRLRGRQCFLLPISYQTVSIRGTVEEIYAEARRLYDLLATPAGGLIGYVEEYGCMGMSRENYRACAEAFRRLKR